MDGGDSKTKKRQKERCISAFFYLFSASFCLFSVSFCLFLSIFCLFLSLTVSLCPLLSLFCPFSASFCLLLSLLGVDILDDDREEPPTSILIPVNLLSHKHFLIGLRIVVPWSYSSHSHQTKHSETSAAWGPGKMECVEVATFPLHRSGAVGRSVLPGPPTQDHNMRYRRPPGRG